MKKMTADECIDAINSQKCFHAEVEGAAFNIKIDDYSPFVCTAIHDGHTLRHDIIDNCALSEAERLYEEDPFTAEMVAKLPLVIKGLDSRYEYDLNRPPETCVYDEAWGKPVWKTPLSEAQKNTSLQKHHTFYRVLGELYKKLESIHGSCLIYDMHSYNHKRIEKDTPVFNVGTEQLDKKWSKVIKHWVEQLNNISLAGINSRAAADDVFYGRGYQATFVHNNLSNTLVLPTEIKKVFMDELSGAPDSDVISKLQHELSECIKNNAALFSAIK